MKECNVNGKRVMYYDSIDEMPILRYHKFNKCLLIDAGVGSDVNDLLVHLEIAIKYAQKGQKEAITELLNLKQAISLAIEETGPKSLAFACVVSLIDGKEYNDISDDGLKRTVAELNGNRGMLYQVIDAVKKKMEEEVAVYFASHKDDSSLKEYYDLLKKRTMAVLDEITTGKGANIDEIEFQMLMLSKPKPFHGSGSAEIEYDKQFARICLLINQVIGADAKDMTVMEYYNAFDYVKQELKRKNNGR